MTNFYYFRNKRTQETTPNEEIAKDWIHFGDDTEVFIGLPVDENKSPIRVIVGEKN